MRHENNKLATYNDSAFHRGPQEVRPGAKRLFLPFLLSCVVFFCTAVMNMRHVTTDRSDAYVSAVFCHDFFWSQSLHDLRV